MSAAISTPDIVVARSPEMSSNLHRDAIENAWGRL